MLRRGYTVGGGDTVLWVEMVVVVVTHGIICDGDELCVGGL